MFNKLKMKMKIPIEISLVLSTGHVSAETARTLDYWAGNNAGATKTPLHPVFNKGAYGWWVYVGEDDAGPDGADLPADLRACLALARQIKCEWIMFDRDAPAIDRLPTYEW